jgi:hypothetical protein
VLVDSYKVARWMNVRKLTHGHVAARIELPVADLEEALSVRATQFPDAVGDRLAGVLDVDQAQIVASPTLAPPVCTMSAAEVHATCRPIERDGIHFYNYYSMAGGPGRVAPVILDILCPADRLPQLNNGHLEPAITINIGPGDIHGRWGEELTEATWSVLHANHGEDDWIIGESYVEPSYCPHSYSLAGEAPARIISYTAESNLADLLAQLNDWTDEAFGAFVEGVGGGRGRLLGELLARRGFEPVDAARAAGVDAATLQATLDGSGDGLDPADLRRLGEALGFDYRPLLPAPHRHDSVGKTSCSLAESAASQRRFRGYRVASMASAPHLSDLTGLFIKVERAEEREPRLDLADLGETHYMVTSGDLTLVWRDVDGSLARRTFGPDGTAWVAPYVEHAWVGDGAVIKLGSGRHVGVLDQLELTNTFAVAHTVRRARGDVLGWGYDTAGSD